MIAVIDYKSGNLCSVGNALKRIGCDFRITGDKSVIRAASHVILPGVGEAGSTMEALRNSGLDKLLPELTQPVLGICIGMQLMCLYSEEGDTQCLGLFDTAVRKIQVQAGLKVPHMGWNTVIGLSSPLTNEMADGSYFYYVHSYAPERCAQTVGVTEYSGTFSAILQNGNFFGTQFHPEKSGEAGEQLLQNFLTI
jgi:glutamine amidotransferase